MRTDAKVVLVVAVFVRWMIGVFTAAMVASSRIAVMFRFGCSLFHARDATATRKLLRDKAEDEECQKRQAHCRAFTNRTNSHDDRSIGAEWLDVNCNLPVGVTA